MKRFLFLFLLLLGSRAFAQQQFIGDWSGALHVGIDLHVIFHITNGADNTLAATMDCPDQSVKGYGCGAITAKSDSITIDVPGIRGNFAGKLTADTIDGQWTQAGHPFPLGLHKGMQAAPKRPQTPQPPYSYKSEDVIYYNEDSTQRFGATITIPNGKGPFAAVLLITGSGQQNRDEEIEQHHPFAVIADYLTKKGYAVLRVDDRGVGQSTGDLTHATTADFAKDVNVSLNYLKTRKEINNKKMGLMGHSEGGMIAPMVANERKDVAFIILLAGPATPIAQLMQDQTAAVLRSKGMDEKGIAAARDLYGRLEKVVLANKDYAAFEQQLVTAIQQWQAQTPPELVLAATGIHNDSTRNQLAETFAQQTGNAWFRYFLAMDPQTYLTKLTCKVLALNGDKDIQVPAATNVPAMRAALAKSKAKEYEVKELPGLNHLFQQCHTCGTDEYGQLEETFSPEALKVIGDWMDKEVK